jgi:hypothetical protein
MRLEEWHLPLARISWICFVALARSSLLTFGRGADLGALGRTVFGEVGGAAALDGGA